MGRTWRVAIAVITAIGLISSVGAASAQQRGGAAAPAAGATAPASARSSLIPRHPDYLGALAPENIARHKGKAAFDTTGTWFTDTSFSRFTFGIPAYPKFLPDAQKAYDEGQAARAAGRNYRDSIGQCFPPGMPMMMTRVWNIAWVQIPTVIFVVSGFNNNFRQIFLDGRSFTDPDIVVSTYNGESIGRWEGDTLVVHTKYFETNEHWIDTGIPVSDEFEIVERIRMLNDGKTMEIAYTMTDPRNWEGEWKTVKRWSRQDYSDIGEVECLPDLNEHLPSTVRGSEAVDERLGK